MIGAMLSNGYRAKVLKTRFARHKILIENIFIKYVKKGLVCATSSLIVSYVGLTGVLSLRLTKCRHVFYNRDTN